MAYAATPPEIRFSKKVDVRGPTECWPWEGAKKRTGYGNFLWVTGEFMSAHRAAWRIANGDIPDGAVVRHACDNPSCVNPEHLLIGTLKDNSQDMLRRNRNRPPRKLTANNVREIRRAVDAGAVKQELAAKFGVSPAAVSYILSGKTYRWVK